MEAEAAGAAAEIAAAAGGTAAAGAAGVSQEEHAGLQERVRQLEARNAALEAAEARREVGAALGGVRLCEGAYAIAPACRERLTTALLGIGAAERAPLVTALTGLQLQPLGTVGFDEAAGHERDGGTETLTEADRQVIRAEAVRKRLPESEVEQQFLAARRERHGRGGGSRG